MPRIRGCGSTSASAAAWRRCSTTTGDKIELLNSLLLSMPGTPIIYYGDEIGMGDNIYLGDRNGVRTPMQWSPDRNAGFSRADPQRLYLPPIMDPVYGYQAVNVEAQQRDACVAAELDAAAYRGAQAHRAFGRGTLEFLHPGNRKILAYLCAGGEAQRRRDRAVRRQPGRRPSRSSWTWPISRAGAGRAAGADALPADRRAALSADAARSRLLLVPSSRRTPRPPPGTRTRSRP